MMPANPNDRIPSAGSNLVLPVNRLAERVRQSFHQHREVSREGFLQGARRREIDSHGQRETVLGAGSVQRGSKRTNKGATIPPPSSAEDIRIYGWLAERLAALHYERYGFWPRLRRFLFGNRVVRWLGLSHQ